MIGLRRSKLGWTYYKAAQKTGLDRSEVYRYENKHGYSLRRSLFWLSELYADYRVTLAMIFKNNCHGHHCLVEGGNIVLVTNPDKQERFAPLIERHFPGFEAKVFNSSQEALTFLEQNQARCIIATETIDTMGGLSFYRTLSKRETNTYTPRVFISEPRTLGTGERQRLVKKARKEYAAYYPEKWHDIGFVRKIRMQMIFAGV